MNTEITILHNAVVSGNLQNVRMILDRHLKEKNTVELSFLVNGIVSGATPLIVACRFGHLPIVKYLIEECEADIEQVGSVQFDGELIDGAPALWCASAAGHLDIVKYLVNAGAQVNKTTYTNSTPLRAACFDGHMDIVQFLIENSADIEMANRHGHTCLMISCYKGHINIVQYLLDKRVNVNRKSLKGNTALHDCAESGCLHIMKLLFKYDARMEKDAYGITPLLAAAVTGNTKIVEHLISREECTREDKVEAMELLGATHVDKKRDLSGALKFWKAALLERYRDVLNVLPKSKQHKSLVQAYKCSTEVTSMDELEDIHDDPDEMRMQALLIRERILGPTHPDTSYYIRFRGAVYADCGDFAWCISLWRYALDMQQGHLEPLSPLTQSSFLSFAELFSFMTSDNSDRLKAHTQQSPTALLDSMLFVLDSCVLEIERGKKYLASLENNYKSEQDTSSFQKYLIIVLHLISLIGRLVQKVSDKERVSKFKTSVRKLVRLKCLHETSRTLLHLACTKEASSVGRFPVCDFPDPVVVLALLEAGADSCERDRHGNMPLHLAACVSSQDVIKVLLSKGAHLDATNNQLQTPADLLTDVHMHTIVPPLNHINLQCLAARIVRKYKIPYVGEIPIDLESFVQLH